jgi:hypothetical protein
MDVYHTIKNLCQSSGFSPRSFTTLQEALEYLSSFIPDFDPTQPTVESSIALDAVALILMENQRTRDQHCGFSGMVQLLASWKAIWPTISILLQKGRHLLLGRTIIEEEEQVPEFTIKLLTVMSAFVSCVLTAGSLVNVDTASLCFTSRFLSEVPEFADVCLNFWIDTIHCNEQYLLTACRRTLNLAVEMTLKMSKISNQDLFHKILGTIRSIPCSMEVLVDFALDMTICVEVDFTSLQSAMFVISTTSSTFPDCFDHVCHAHGVRNFCVALRATTQKQHSSADPAQFVGCLKVGFRFLRDVFVKMGHPAMVVAFDHGLLESMSRTTLAILWDQKELNSSLPSLSNPGESPPLSACYREILELIPVRLLYRDIFHAVQYSVKELENSEFVGLIKKVALKNPKSSLGSIGLAWNMLVEETVLTKNTRKEFYIWSKKHGKGWCANRKVRCLDPMALVEH